MTRRFIATALPALLWLASSTPAHTRSQARDTAVEVFSPGVLSDGEVFRGEFAPDGLFYFFKKVRPDSEEYRIFTSRVSNGAWTPPERLDVGGDHSNTYPTISPDGRRLVFASNRPAAGMDGRPNFYLWQADRTETGWSQPRLLANVNVAGHYHSWAAFRHDGKLSFRRTTPDWSASQTLLATFEGNDVARVDVDATLEQCRARRPDLRIAGGLAGPRPGLYFLDVPVARTGPAAAHSDIWVCEIDGASTTLRALGPEINTPVYETFPFFSRDGRDLFFVRGFRTFMRVQMDAALRR